MAKKKSGSRSAPPKKRGKVTGKIISAAASTSEAASEIVRHADKIARHAALITGAIQDDPVGSCIYVDAQGQIQCEAPVTQSYCSGISGGHFRAGGRCS
jgi:hypothetical protein